MLCTWERSALYLREKSPQRGSYSCVSETVQDAGIYPTLVTAALLIVQFNFPWWRTGIQPRLIKAHIFFLYASRSPNFLSLHCAQQEKDCIHYFITSHRQWLTHHWWCQSVHSMSKSQPAFAQSLHRQNESSITNKILKTLPSMKLPTYPRAPPWTHLLHN